MCTLKARKRWKGARTLGFPSLSLCCYAPVCTLCTFWAFLRFLGFLARTQKAQREVEMNFGAKHPRHIQLEIGFRKKAQKARQAFGASPGGPGCTCGSASGVPVGAPLGTWVGTRGALRGALHPKSLETSKTYETLGFLHPLRRANEARK